MRLFLVRDVRRARTPQKITPQNAFQLNLIDHIDDVIEADEAGLWRNQRKKNVFFFLYLLRVSSFCTLAANKDSLVSTNFHKASSTVETSVKIYSYRVDAVHTDAFKILGGLTRNGNAYFFFCKAPAFRSI